MFPAAKACFDDTSQYLVPPLNDPNSIALLNLSRGLSELCSTLAAEIHRLHTDIANLRSDIQDVKRRVSRP